MLHRPAPKLLRGATGLAVALSLAFPCVSTAQTAGETAKAPAAGLLVGAVQIDGAQGLPPDIFAPELERAIGQMLDTQGLRELARGIAQRARQHGYIFASALVPPQDVQSGVVRVSLDKGTIHSVRLVGSNDRKLRAVLEKLIGSAPTRAQAERQLALAEDIPGIRIVSTRLEKDGPDSVLVVEAREERATGQIALDNWGSAAYGPLRARANASLHGGLIDGDSATIQMVASPLQPGELVFASARYALGLGQNGAQIGASVAIGGSDPGGRAADYDLTGANRYASLFASYPLHRTRQSGLWLNGDVAYLRVDQSVADELIQRDDTTSLTISFNGTHPLAEGRLNWGAGIVQGMDVLGATATATSLKSRADGKAVFTKGFAWFNWLGGLGDGFSLRLAAQAQLASAPLLAAHEITLGGAYFGRGYHFSELFGDQGIIGLAELRRAVRLPWRQVSWGHIYSFVDGGYIDNLGSGYGGGSLASAGGGMRVGLGGFELGVEGAVPLLDERYESGDRSARFNLVAGYNF